MKSKIISSIALAAALSAAASGASAASLTWMSYSEADLSDARSDRADDIDTDNLVSFEDFESEEFTPVPDAPGSGGGDGADPAFSKTPLDTAVGTFTTTAGNSCGGSCDAPTDQSLIRDTSSFGRYNTTLDGNNWLDSNDNAAINLDITGLGLFDSISLFLMDVDDVGSVEFSVSFDTETLLAPQVFNIAVDEFENQKQGDADLFLLSINLDSLVDNAFLSFSIDDGDGFGLDDVRIGSSVAPVPVPATLPLLMAGIGGLGWAARRRKKASGVSHSTEQKSALQGRLFLYRMQPTAAAYSCILRES